MTGSEIQSTQHARGLATARRPAPAPLEQHEQLRRQAQRWVAHTFYGTLLKQMRNSPFRTDLTEGGRGGQVFHMLLDQNLADHMARSSDRTLVNSIVRKIEGSDAYRRNEQARKAALRAPTPALRKHVARPG